MINNVLQFIIQLNLIIIGLAFLFQFMNGTLGMGFGSLSPILIAWGFAPLEVIPAIIFTSGILGIISGILHLIFRNIDFWYGTKNIKIAGLFFIAGIIAIFIGVLVAINISAIVLKTYIGSLTLLMGFILIFNDILKNRNKEYFMKLQQYFNSFEKKILEKKKKSFYDPHEDIEMHKEVSWLRLGALASLASFNKGMTGSGYGPVLSAGQVISGMDSKRAVGITVLVEGLVSSVGFIVYYFLNQTTTINWTLTISILAGGLVAAPISALIVKKTHPGNLKYAMGILCALIGLFSIIDTIIDFTILM